MQIRNYNKEDILLIENLGKKLHNNYKVNLDVFSNIYICTVDNNIIGFITKGYGVSVHRMNCPNLDDLNERLINVSWGDTEGKKYSTSLIIKAEKKDNTLLEIISKASNNGINVEKINTYNNEDNVTFDLTVIVENIDKLNKFINNIKNINNIIDIERKIKWEF